MNETLIFILTIAITTIIGALVGIQFSKLKNKSTVSILEERQKNLEETLQQLKITLEKTEREREDIRKEKEHYSAELTKKNTEFDTLQAKNIERDQALAKEQEQLRKDFELMAAKILEEKSEKFTLQNKENLKTILNPLQEKIQHFEKKVESTQKESIGMHAALKEQLLSLKDLNQQMTKEATNLTRALKGDSKMQGNWGELVLERVLEKSGLEKEREYFVQQSFTKDDGTKILPDVVIHLPNNKRMIIDSKVSLTDYERYANAEEKEKPIYLKAHINSIKKHVDQLSNKNYQDIYDIESPDFVLLFIPIEPAFAAAVNQDNSLYSKAFEQNIVIVTPATLLATLRTIDTMWNNEKQQQNAIEIAKQAGALYDKFYGLMLDLTGVGKKIDAAKSDYAAAMNKLVEGKGNLVGRIENLKKMGAKAKKALPEKIIKRAEDALE